MTNLQFFNPFANRLLSKQQVAEMLGVSISTIDRMMKAKSINFVRVGLRRIGFRREDIDVYISRNLDLSDSQRKQENASAIAVLQKITNEKGQFLALKNVEDCC